MVSQFVKTVKNIFNDNILLSILLLAFLLRLINLDQSFWLDEGAQVVQSAKSLSEIWQLEKDFHPPLYYYLVHFWMEGGTREWYLRLSSVFTGVLNVYVVYLIGQTLSDERTKERKNKRYFQDTLPYWAGILLAIAPYHIYYSQELRMYALSALLSSLIIYSLLKKNWWLHTLAWVASWYTFYLLPLMAAVELVYLFIYKRICLRWWAKSFGLSVLAFLPWWQILSQQLGLGTKFSSMLPGWASLSSPGPVRALPLTYVKFVLGRIDFDNNYFYGGVILLSLVFVGPVLYRTWIARNKLISLLIYWFIIPLLLAWGVSFWVPLNGPWRMLFVLPSFYLLLAAGIEQFKGRVKYMLAGGVIFISLFGLFNYYLNPRFHREDWRGAVRMVEHYLYDSEVTPSSFSSKRGRTSLVTFAFGEPFAPYRWYATKLDNVVGLGDGLVIRRDVSMKRLYTALDGKESVYHFDYLSDLSDPERLVPKWLEDVGFELKETHNFRGVGFVYRYQRIKADEKRI